MSDRMAAFQLFEGIASMCVTFSVKKERTLSLAASSFFLGKDFDNGTQLS
jgi:hypothetical protein